MTDNVEPIHRISLSSQADAAKAIVALAEKLILVAKTPTQKARVEEKLVAMRTKRDNLIERAVRVEGYHA